MPLDQPEQLKHFEQVIGKTSAETLCRRSARIPVPTGLEAQHIEAEGLPLPQPSLSPELLRKGKQGLLPVSQSAVLRLGEPDRTVHRSAQSLTALTPSSGFDRDRLPGPEGSLRIVAHGDGDSIGGMSPEALASFLRQQGIRQLGHIELTSCDSSELLERFESALSKSGIQVGEVRGHAGEIAISETSGSVMTQGQISGGNDTLGQAKIRRIQDHPLIPESEFASGFPVDNIVSPNERVPLPMLGDLFNFTNEPREMFQYGIEYVHRVMGQPPQSVLDCFKAATEVDLLKSLSENKWIKQTVIDATRESDRYVSNNSSTFGDIGYEPKSFGFNGGCKQSSYILGYLINYLVTDYGNASQQSITARLKLEESNMRGHNFLSYLDHPATNTREKFVNMTFSEFKSHQSYILDPSWRQFSLTAQEGGGSYLKRKFSDISRESQRLVKSQPMIYFGTMQDHRPLLRYIDCRND